MKKTTFLKICTALFCLLIIGFAEAQERTGKRPMAFGKPVKAENINPLTGHVRCASTEYEEFLQANDPKRKTDAEFEAWLKPLLEEHRAMQLAGSVINDVIIIPVVVHVIHSGQPVGTAPNITDAQVISQITVMNNDFRRLAGTPGFNTNAVGADTMIQFALAQQDPDGNPTNGINRVNLCQPSWSMASTNSTVKPQTQWDPNLYLNMWSVNFTGGSILGYAQFPNGSGLGGLDTSGGAASTDGVVANYSTFGSINYNDGSFLLSAPYNEGRTMTHEVGHWIGLRHIWGDGGCAFDDFCADTPAAGAENYGCATGVDSCPAPGLDMVQNYMDYSDDACMNIFTQNQKERMVVIMNNAARRVTLKTSTKDQPMTLFANDAELFAEPSCTGATAPSTCVTQPATSPVQKFTIYNRGTAPLTSATISYTVNGGAASTYTWTGNLLTHKFATFEVTLTGAASGTLQATIVNANGTPDQRASNNATSGTVTAAGGGPANFATNDVVFRLQKDNYGSETSWTLKNSAGTTLYSGGNYTDQTFGGALITQSWTLPSNDCYVFTINDDYGDGICCAYGQGYYDIKSADGATTLISGGQFNQTESKSFTINLLASESFSSSKSIVLYPSPAKDVINISMGTDLGLPDTYTITNYLGQTVANKAVANTNDLTVNVSSFTSGVYFVSLTKNGEKNVIRFIKE